MTKCDHCQKQYEGPVCPRCAVEVALDSSVEGPPALAAASQALHSDVSIEPVESVQPGSTRDRDEALAEGDSLGHFKIVEFLGEGGMSRVYAAHDMNLERKVAIKVPKAEVVRNPTLLAQFRHEGRSIGRLKTPFVIGVHEAPEFDGVPCQVFDYLHGETVAQFIENAGRLPPREAARIGRDVALGLLEVHIHGRIHGDVKPSNVIVDNKGAKIIDFGLSRRFSDANLESGKIYGTPAYMSPQSLDGEPKTVSDDVYGLGCTLFEMLSGKPAFFCGASMSLLRQEKEQPPSVVQSRDIPRGLAAMVDSLIAPNPIDRPATAKEVAALLDEWLAEKSRVRLMAAVSTLAAVAALACLVFLLYPRGDVAVLSVDGKVRKVCRSLVDGVAIARDGETLELRANGPFRCDEAIVSDKALTIRSADEITAVLELTRPAAGKGAITFHESLAMDRLILRCSDAESSINAVVYCDGDSLLVTDCRFELPRNSTGLACIRAIGSKEIVSRHNIFSSHGGIAIGWRPGEESNLTVSNCLAMRTTAVEYEVSNETAQQRRARIENCTIIGSHVVVVVPADPNRIDSVPDAPTRIEARSNVFRTSTSLVQFEGWPTERGPAATITSHLDWRDLANLHATDLDRSVIWIPRNGESKTLRADGLAAWTSHWGMSIEEVDAIIALGGNVEEYFGDGLKARAAHDLLTRLNGAGKLLCGIGDGPAVLADGGFLKGRRAAVQPSQQRKLSEGGASVSFSENPIKDGNVITAESNFHTGSLIGYLPPTPVVFALIAETDFWFDDYRAVKYEVERSGGTLLTVSTTTGQAKPEKSGGGTSIHPDVLLPLLRHDGGVMLRPGANTWIASELVATDPKNVTVEQLRIYADSLNQPAGAPVPGIDVDRFTSSRPTR